jgi:hypothetical protein
VIFADMGTSGSNAGATGRFGSEVTGRVDDIADFGGSNGLTGAASIGGLIEGGGGREGSWEGTGVGSDVGSGGGVADPALGGTVGDAAGGTVRGSAGGEAAGNGSDVCRIFGSGSTGGGGRSCAGWGGGGAGGCAAAVVSFPFDRERRMRTTPARIAIARRATTIVVVGMRPPV